MELWSGRFIARRKGALLATRPTGGLLNCAQYTMPGYAIIRSGREVMSQTVQVPLTGSNVIPSSDGPAQPQQTERESGFVNNVYVPPSSRQSLHKARLGQSIAKQVEQQTETAPQWRDNPNGQGGRFEHRPVERQAEPEPSAPLLKNSSPEPTDAVQHQLNQLTQAVMLLAGVEPDRGPKMPNAAAYDFFDPQSEGEFYQAMNEYVEAVTQQRLQKEFEPYRPALTGIQKQQEMESHFNELRDAHGQEPHFRTTMKVALQMVADSGNTLTIKDAYAKADSRDGKPGEKNGHLPAALTGRGKKIGQISLKDIVLHNQMSGRSNTR